MKQSYYCYSMMLYLILSEHTLHIIIIITSDHQLNNNGCYLVIATAVEPSLVLFSFDNDIDW